MLSLDDPRWQTLAGGYRTPFDPTPSLRRLAAAWDDRAAWDELWGGLHHQGDVGEASYAAVPALVELGGRVPVRGWRLFALCATIESERHARRNPPLPGWLVDEYGRAWGDLLGLALDELRNASDPLVIRSALAVVALARGSTKLGVLIAGLDDSEIDEMLEESVAWSEHYRDTPVAPATRDAVRHGVDADERIHRSAPEFVSIDHVQLGMPRGGEERARSFYGEVLGLAELSPPPPLSGVWFGAGGVELHLSVEAEFRPSPRAHPGIRVRGLSELAARCAAAGVPLSLDTRYPGRTRYYVEDPFGNRLELLQLATEGRSP